MFCKQPSSLERLRDIFFQFDRAAKSEAVDFGKRA